MPTRPRWLLTLPDTLAQFDALADGTHRDYGSLLLHCGCPCPQDPIGRPPRSSPSRFGKGFPSFVVFWSA